MSSLVNLDREGTHGRERVYRCTGCPSERAYWIGVAPDHARLELVASFAAFAHRVHDCHSGNRDFCPPVRIAGRP